MPGQCACPGKQRCDPRLVSAQECLPAQASGQARSRQSRRMCKPFNSPSHPSSLPPCPGTTPASPTAGLGSAPTRAHARTTGAAPTAFVTWMDTARFAWAGGCRTGAGGVGGRLGPLGWGWWPAHFIWGPGGLRCHPLRCTRTEFIPSSPFIAWGLPVNTCPNLLVSALAGCVPLPQVLRSPSLVHLPRRRSVLEWHVQGGASSSWGPPAAQGRCNICHDLYA